MLEHGRTVEAAGVDGFRSIPGDLFWTRTASILSVRVSDCCLVGRGRSFEGGEKPWPDMLSEERLASEIRQVAGR